MTVTCPFCHDPVNTEPMPASDKQAPGERLTDHGDPVGTCPGNGLDVSLIQATETN